MTDKDNLEQENEAGVEQDETVAEEVVAEEAPAEEAPAEEESVKIDSSDDESK